jgi:hypothetical protein
MEQSWHTVELRALVSLNITESRILHSYKTNRNIECKVFISNCALLKTFKVDCYLSWRRTKVKALQLGNACQENKQ